MARSTSGTICTDDICRIIETGARSGVYALKLKGIGLEVEYLRSKEQDKVGVSPEYSAPVAFATVPEESSGNSMEGPYDKEVLEKMARELKEERLATLALEDPVEYEELLANPDRYIALFGNEG